MRLGTLRIKNNLMREYLYDLNDFFTHVPPNQCYEILRPLGVHILSREPDRFAPSIYREGDFKFEMIRFFGTCGGEMVFNAGRANRVFEVIRERLAAEYTKDKPRLKRFQVRAFYEDIGV